MKLKAAKKVPLNQTTHSVRASQAALQYGVGAMVDFPNQTLMTAAPEFWQEQIVQVHDERLEKALHVDNFGLPGGKDECKEGISYVRFPEWYFCPKCRKFQPIKDWTTEYRLKANRKIKENDPDMVKNVRCYQCGQDLVVTRIVTACECGHIDDFPWVKWVHCKNMRGGPKPICTNPVLAFKTGGSSSEGLEGLTIFCETCKAKATLKGAFDKDALRELDKKYNGEYDFRCTGRHPWRHTKEKCDEYPKVLQRGSSSVYFPIAVSSLVIPPYSSLITRRIEDSNAFLQCKIEIAGFKRNELLKEMLPKLIENSIEKFANDISLEIGVSAEKIRPVLERKWMNSADDEKEFITNIKYKAEEYEALNGETSMYADEYGDFLREETEIESYAIPFVKRISLIHKVREVQALIGFSRLKPIETEMGEINTDHIVTVKQPETNWYPAYEVRGEGIFIEFDENEIFEWQQKKEIVQRVNVLNENYQKSFIGQSRPKKITPKFLLLHTISHALIKQLSFECGYSIASLKERLYCSESADGKEMAGILIYTASGDSEGTMGGLVRQGRADTFPNVFKKAMEEAMVCSNDPVCSLSMGQGRDSLNLAACYSCSLIPETSCEEFNLFLDRGTIVGTYENRDMGFYSKQLYHSLLRENSNMTENRNSTNQKRNASFIVIDRGVDLRDTDYSDIWKYLSVWSDVEKEKDMLSELARMSTCFSQKEKPYSDCTFRINENNEQYKCDLFWEMSKVAFFTSDNEECYLAAKDSDTQCFFSMDRTTTPNRILNALKER